MIGYDDIEIGAYLDVPLSSVRQPFAEIGAAAAELVFELMAGLPPGTRVLEPELIRRGSLA